MYSIISAIGNNNEIGKDNDLIWKLKSDMKYFKETTYNHKVIMGSKTFYSIPKRMENREYIVISRNNNYPDYVKVYNDINDLFNDFDNSDEEIFVIGGESIYRTFIDKCSKLYLTHINRECYDATNYFPTFDKNLYDSEIISSGIENDIEYKMVLYKRK